jgi:hypothetical protein
MDGRVVVRKGRMTAVTMKVRKKETCEMEAIDRQSMTTSDQKELKKASDHKLLVLYSVVFITGFFTPS